LFLCRLQESVKMAYMRMNASIGDLYPKFRSGLHGKRARKQTRPSKCKVPVPSRARLHASKMVGLLWNCLFLMDMSMRTISCQTTRPAPMLRCLDARDANVIFRSRKNGEQDDVPNLRIAHESLAESHSCTAGKESSITVILGNGVHVGRVSRLYRVTILSWLYCNAPTVVDTAVCAYEKVLSWAYCGSHMRQTLFLATVIFEGWWKLC